METIDYAEFIYRAGAGSVSFFWTPLVLWTCLAAGCLFFLRYKTALSPQANYQMLTALLLALPLGTLLALVLPFSVTAPEVLHLMEVPLSQASNVEPGLPTAPAEPVISWHFYHLWGLVTLLLIFISLFRVFQLVRKTIHLRHVASTIQGVLPASVSHSLDQICRSWGIQEDVYVVFSAEDHVPMTFGWRKAFIIVPEALREQQEALHMTIIHELAHIRNADFVRQWVEKAISSFFFFHPLVHLLAQKIDQSREMNCDLEVLSQQDISPKQYASLLLNFANPKTNTPLLSISMSDETSHLKKRIAAMKAYPFFVQNNLRSRKSTLALAAVLFAASTLIVACEVKFHTDNSITIIEAPAAPEASTGVTVTQDNAPADGNGEVFMIVEEMPELIGGLKSIQEKIKYPDIAQKAGIEGRVFVQFVVDTEGSVVDPVVVRGIGSGCDEEAIRAIQEARFKPGRQGGKLVKVKMSIPITFKAETL